MERRFLIALNDPFGLRPGGLKRSDESHVVVFGQRGRGLAEQMQIEERAIVRIGTLSKGLAAMGGFVAGSQALIDWLWNRSRTQMFSTALPPAVCAAASAALDIVEQEPQRRRHLLALADSFRRRLRSAGFNIPADGTGPIVPVILDDPQRAVSAQAQLEEKGFLVAAIRPPTVPRGTSRLRMTVSCAHTEDDVGRLFAGLRQIIRD